VTVAWTKLDRYGRIIGTIMLGGSDVNLAQISAGMAWVYRKYLNELPVETRGEYLSAEAEAQSARRGLWSEPSPVPPWDWRKPRRGDEP
jgi:endonuclease YncB( thermonuclease family)